MRCGLILLCCGCGPVSAGDAGKEEGADGQSHGD